MDSIDMSRLLMEEEEAEKRSKAFEELKPYCLDLLDLVQHPKKRSPTLPALLRFLQNSSPDTLQPFFDYTLFPLLLLLDAAVGSRSPQKIDSEGKDVQTNVPKKPHRVSDIVAEGVLHCLEELLRKCYLGSTDQLVVILKKLTYAALLSPSVATEEFREGIIKCLRALLMNLLPCSDNSCLCKHSIGLPALLDGGDLLTEPIRCSRHSLETEECLLAFLQTQNASAAVGHWLSLLLDAADIEAARGLRGSAKLRIEAFLTVRVLVAKVGTADSLAFFLPGVVSKFIKVLRVARTMSSGAAGNVEAINQAIRGLAEFLMIVLGDDANSSSLGISLNSKRNSKMYESMDMFLEELRQLPIRQKGHKILAEDVDGRAESKEPAIYESQEQKSADFAKVARTFMVNRTKRWIEDTSANIHKLLSGTFPHICVHPAERLRRGLLAAVQGILSKCSDTLKDSRLMLLECLCVLVVDDSEELSASAQDFLGHVFSFSRKKDVERDVAEMFGRLVEKLPKAVLGDEESFALSSAQQLLVVMFFSGPRLVVDQLLHSPVMAARFLDVLATCLGQQSVFSGSLEKLVQRRPSSMGYIHSVAELKAQSFTGVLQSPSSAAQHEVPELSGDKVKDIRYLPEKAKMNYELPHMPPWFINVGSQKLYESLAHIIRLVGLALFADPRCEGNLEAVADIPLGFMRRLVSEIRVRDYNEESWQSWYCRTGSGQLLRQAGTAVCILNEMIFGLSEQAVENIKQKFCKSSVNGHDLQKVNAQLSDIQSSWISHDMNCLSSWNLIHENGTWSQLADCVGRILHEYLSSEVWTLPLEPGFLLTEHDGKAEDISLHFFSDAAMLHQVVIEGIGIFNMSLGKSFTSSGFLHSSLYLLLENLVSPHFQVRTAADAVLHIISTTSGYPSVAQLVLENADYVIDAICQQLRHLDLNPHVPNVLAAMLSYIGVAEKILPLLEEPMRSISLELEILGRHQHPDMTIPFLKAVAEIAKSLKHEARFLPDEAESFLRHTKLRIDEIEQELKSEARQTSKTHCEDTDCIRSELEEITFKFKNSKSYRRTVGSLTTSCLVVATPLLASSKQTECLVALHIIEEGISTLAKVEAAYRCENEVKESIEEIIEMCSMYELRDSLDAAEQGTDENRLLPAMNKIWPFFVVCVQNANPAVVRKCLAVVSSSVQICGGDFFSRRFHTDGAHFWRLLTTSPFHVKHDARKERITLQLPYRSAVSSLEEPLAEGSTLKVQAAVLNMIADLSRNKKSASALSVVLKKVSGLVVGIACSGVGGLQDASLNALQGLASIDPDLIWLLLADVYFSIKREDIPSPPSSELPEIAVVFPPASSLKEYLHVQYGGQTYGFEINFSSVELVFEKMNALAFPDQMYR